MILNKQEVVNSNSSQQTLIDNLDKERSMDILNMSNPDLKTDITGALEANSSGSSSSGYSSSCSGSSNTSSYEPDNDSYQSDHAMDHLIDDPAYKLWPMSIMGANVRSDEKNDPVYSMTLVIMRSDEKNHPVASKMLVSARSDEKNDPTGIPCKQTDSWKSCILALAFNSCVPAFIQNLTNVLALADCLLSKSAFCADDVNHVGAIFNSEGQTSGCRELLRKVVCNSCYGDFLDSLQSKNVSEEDLRKQFSEEYSRHLQLDRSVIIEQMKDYICKIWEPRAAIERSIGPISKILGNEMAVSVDVLDSLHYLGVITAAEKSEVLRQPRRKRKVQRLMKCLSRAGQSTSEFVQFIFILWHAPKSLDLKMAINDSLLDVQRPREPLEDTPLISSVQVCLRLTPVDEMLLRKADEIFTPQLITGNKEDLNRLKRQLAIFNCTLRKVLPGSIVLDLEFHSIKGLLRFWLEYLDGALKQELSKYVLKPELYQALDGAEVDLVLNINERDLLQALKFLQDRQGMTDKISRATNGQVDTSPADHSVTIAQHRKPRVNKYRDFMYMCDTEEIRRLLCPDDDDDGDDMEVDTDRTTLDVSETGFTLPATHMPGVSTMHSGLPMVTSEDDKNQWRQLCDRLRDILQDKVSQVVISTELSASEPFRQVPCEQNWSSRLRDFLRRRTASTKPRLEINPQHDTMKWLRDELVAGTDDVAVAEKVQSMFSSLESDVVFRNESTAIPGEYDQARMPQEYAEIQIQLLPNTDHTSKMDISPIKRHELTKGLLLDQTIFQEIYDGHRGLGVFIQPDGIFGCLFINMHTLDLAMFHELSSTHDFEWFDSSEIFTKALQGRRVKCLLKKISIKKFSQDDDEPRRELGASY